MMTHKLFSKILFFAAVFSIGFGLFSGFIEAATLTDGMQATYVLGQPDFETKTPGSTSVKQSFPNGAVYDEVGKRVFVADTSNNRVLVYDVSAGFSNGMSATYVIGQSTLTANGSGTTDSTLNSPLGVAYDLGRQYLFVSDQSNNRVLVFDLSSGLVSGMAATYVLGQTDFTSSGNATGDNRLDTPGIVAYDIATKFLYVVDSNNSRVMVFDTLSMVNGEPAVRVLGQPDFTSNGFSTTDSTFFFPKGVAIGSQNRLFVSDTGNNRVLVFNVSSITNGEAAVNVLGQTDFTSGGSPVSTDSSTISSPWGISFDESADRLFVGDQGNSRVLVFNVSSITNGEAAVNVLGQTDFTSFTSFIHTTNGIHHYQTTGVWWDKPSQHLFVSDNSHSRTLVYDLSVPDTTAPILVEGTTVPTPSTDTTPTYSFSSDEEGTITYGGSCSSGTTSAVIGTNTITFDTLSVGTYTNCTITVTDSAMNSSSPLSVSAFTITAPAPTPSSTPTTGTITGSGILGGSKVYGCHDPKATNYEPNLPPSQYVCTYTALPVSPVVSVVSPSSAEVQASMPLLKQGMKGESVMLLQELLRKAGYTVGKDGIFGKKTKAVVMSFQRAHNLSPDGIVGMKTWEVLKK